MTSTILGLIFLLFSMFSLLLILSLLNSSIIILSLKLILCFPPLLIFSQKTSFLIFFISKNDIVEEFIFFLFGITYLFIFSILLLLCIEILFQ